MHNYYTQQTNFFGNATPQSLIEEFGSPLYVYNEAILRERCRQMKGLIKYSKNNVFYSTKANANLELLRIIREEGLHADAMSPGENHVLLAAGYKPEEIFYVCNNISEDEMKYAIKHSSVISVDSISQLRMYGRLNPGGKIAVRFNTGIGAGHHEKVVTGGKETKFGINTDKIDEVKAVLKSYNLRLVGINQHIGSLFMEGKPYLDGVSAILKTAELIDDLEFIDLGGGFGIPYEKQKGEQPLDLELLSQELSDLLSHWAETHNPEITFKTEPGRFVVAECGVLLGQINTLKENSGTHYVGTDLGFSVLIRPTMYDSHHDIEVYSHEGTPKTTMDKAVTIVGNICESGDIIARDRVLPQINEGDVIGVMDAGAYGYSMSSNYNNRLRPAEVLIKTDGTPVLIRRRETLEDMINNFTTGYLLNV